MEWDEGPDPKDSARYIGEHGPYVQSHRLDIYQKAARQLLDAGQAYLCFCSPQRLDEVRKDQQRRKLPPSTTAAAATSPRTTGRSSRPRASPRRPLPHAARRPDDVP